MLLRPLARLSLRAQRWIFGGSILAVQLAVLAFAANEASSFVRQLRDARSMSYMTARTPCRPIKVTVDESFLGEARAQVLCRYEVEGKKYRSDFPLPLSTRNAAYARELAEALAASDTLVVHYDPADPWRAAFSDKPQYLWPSLGLALTLGLFAWAARGSLRAVRMLREWKALDDVLERVEKREAEAKADAEAKAKASSEVAERGTKAEVEIKGLSARNHLPAQPPPGWSVPMASTEGRGAWMIETPGVLVIAQLVRTSRGRVALQVGLLPEDRHRLEDPQALALLRHFRAVDEFVEQTGRDDDLARESPWVRVFLATPRAASPETWGDVKQPREMLN